MSGTTISTVLKTSIVLGSPGYAGPVTITTTGGVNPSVYGATGIELPSGTADPTIVNAGHIAGGAGTNGSVYGIGGGTGGVGVDLQTGTLINSGVVGGGSGGDGSESLGQESYAGGNGGNAILLQSGTIDNSGLVIGGIGGEDESGPGGNGGVGILLQSGIVDNTGTVEGGQGGFAPTGSGDGGAGIAVQSGTLINNGTVTGGNAGLDNYIYQGAAGVGVIAGGGAFISNNGTIAGGVGDISGDLAFAGSSAVGVELTTDATLNNSGLIAGASGLGDAQGATAVYGTSSRIYNSGQIRGGKGYDGQAIYRGHGLGSGGDGIILAGGILSNTGTITAGDGGKYAGPNYRYFTGRAGGDGALLEANTTFNNSIGGIVAGGSAGSGEYTGNGGAGVILYAGDTGFNLGLIVAGAGGNSGYVGHGPISIQAGNGGIGLALGAGATFDNGTYVNPVSHAKVFGTIIGGSAGSNGLINYAAPASGGAGVSVGTNATLINGGFITGGAAAPSATNQVDQGAAGVTNNGTVFNSGIIIGGAGGNDDGFEFAGATYIGGAGGVGVDGGFITNSGTIEGGAGGYGFTAYGAEGDAVDAGTLVVDPGAVFIGDVNVSSLEVSGTSALALSGFGTQFDASDAIIFDAGSHWTIEGDVAGFTGRAIDGFASGDAIVLNGTSIASETFQTGVGLELSIGGSEVTFAIAGSFDTDDFSVVNAGNATISLTSSLTAGTPELSVPGSKSLTAGAIKKLTGITLSETPTAAGETFMVILSDKYGLLSAEGSGITGSGTTMLTLSGSLAQVNADLATLKDTDYTAPADTISVSATDSLGGVAATKTIAVTVNGTIGSGKFLAVPKGVNAGSLTVTHTGVELVQLGGSASSTELNANGTQLVAGAANATQIGGGGFQIVGPKGFSTGTTIGQSGYEIVSAGGDAINTTIATGGTLLLTDGARSSGVIDFAGSNGELLIGGTALPTTVIDGFNLNGSTGDAIVLAGSTYDAGHDTVSLSSGNVLNLDLDGKIEKLFLNPTQNFAGHDFTLSANRFGQVMITDPITGATAMKSGVLNPPKGLEAVDNALLNTKAFATPLNAGMSAGLAGFAGAGFFASLETAAFSTREPYLAVIGSFSSAH